MPEPAKSKWDQRPLPRGRIGPSMMRYRFEHPPRWEQALRRLAFWRKPK
jgi:hypothetical protein